MISLTDDVVERVLAELEQIKSSADKEGAELVAFVMDRVRNRKAVLRPANESAPRVQVIRLKRPIPEDW